MTGVNKFGGTGDKPIIHQIGAAGGRGINVSEINNLFLRRDGANAATGDLNMGNHRILNVTDPTDPSDLVNKRYADGRFVSKNGDAVTGNLLFKVRNNPMIILGCNDLNDAKLFKIMLGNAGNVIQAQVRTPVLLQTTDGFVVKIGNSVIASFAASVINLVGELNMTNRRIMNVGNPTDDVDGVNKRYVDNLIVAIVSRIGESYDLTRYLKLDGRVAMTGDLNLDRHRIINVAAPSDDDDCANKGYVDASISSAIGSRIVEVGTVNMDLKGKKIINVGTPSARDDAATMDYVDGRIGGRLAIDGSNRMTGDLNVGIHRIKNEVDPIIGSDGANKRYVDETVPNLVRAELEKQNYSINLTSKNTSDWIRAFTFGGTEGSVMRITIIQKNTNGNGALQAYILLMRTFDRQY